MSSSGPRREVAYRLFADEFNDSTHTYAESDEDRAPKYLVTPTGARVNRLFVVGVLTEVEEVSDDVVRARVVDPTGAFVIYAGQYQPDALAFFERAEPPVFVAVTGKARTFQPDGSDRVFTSLRPESVNEVDADTRDRWVVQTAEHTLERVAVFGKALETGARGTDLRSTLTAAGVKPGLAAGIPRAIEQYGTTTAYLESVQEMAIDAARLVAGEIDAVERTAIGPDEGGHVDLDTSFADDVVLDGPSEAESVEEAPVSEPEAEAESEAQPTAEPATDESVADSPAEIESSAAAEPEPATGESGSADEPVEASPDETGVSAAEPEEDVEPDERAGEREGEESAVESTPESDSEAPEPADEAEIETDEMYELSEEERAEVEENFDVGFESGAEIGSPDDGSDTETDEAEPPAESEAEDTEDESQDEVETEPEEATAEAAADDEPAEDAATGSTAGDLSESELEDAVVETMKEAAGNDGIERGALVGLVEEEYGAEETAIEDAIQSALLGGRCFESGDDQLKPI